MKSWISLVGIISAICFEFQIQTPFLFSNQLTLTLVLELQDLLYKHQTKFIVVMIKLRENFSEFTRFVPQGMNPFKIHGKFKLEYVPEFIT
jgi:hypothetical protein